MAFPARLLFLSLGLVVRWDDNGVITAPLGTVLVSPTSATAWRGLVVP